MKGGKSDYFFKIGELVKIIGGKIKDGVPLRTTLGRILNDADKDLDIAKEEVKKQFASGKLEKEVEKTREEQRKKREAKKKNK